MITQREAELGARVAELQAENERLHEQLAARDRTNQSLDDYCNRGWARVGTLSSRAGRLLRLARHWRMLCPNRPLTDHLKMILMGRYAALGGFDRGKGAGAVTQVAKEFGLSEATAYRIISEYKRKRVSPKDLPRLQRSYRHRYRDQ